MIVSLQCFNLFLGATIVLEKAASAVNGVLISSIVLNVFLAIGLGVSTKKLWMMIGTL